MRRGQLAPVRRRGLWISWGIAVQAIGCGIPVAVAFSRAHRDGLGGRITRATVRLVWHEMAHNHGDVALIVLGVLLFVAGSVLLARPFTRRPVTLLVAIPVAALAGVVVLGVVALVIAVAIAGFDELNLDPFGDWIDDWSGRRRRRRDHDVRP